MALDERFELLSRVVNIATSSVDANERLNSILVAVNSFYQAHCMALFVLQKSTNSFHLAQCWPKMYLDPKAPNIPIGSGVLSDVALTRKAKNLVMDSSVKDPALKQIAQIDQTVFLFPVQDDGRLYAVAVLVLDKEKSLDEDDIKIWGMIAREMAGTIRNYELYIEAKKRIAELNVLSDMGRYAVSTIDLNKLLDTMASICAKLLGAEGGLVHIASKNSNQKEELFAHYGKIPEKYLTGSIPEEFCSPQPVFPGMKNNRGKTEIADKDTLCVPLSFKAGYNGQLVVFKKQIQEASGLSQAFTVEDQKLINTMGVMISSALENALTVQRIEDLAQRNEEMVQFLGTIFEISTVLMNTVDFEETVQIILHAIIHPAGLDHDHVLLFLVDEVNEVIRPVAQMDKSHFQNPVKELKQTLYEVTGSIMEDNLSPCDELLGLELSLDPKKNVIAKTVDQQTIILVDQSKEDSNIDPRILEALGNYSFVSVPMLAKGKAVGVFVVNNSMNLRPFTDRDIKFLSMLAHLGGLSVETSRLYQSLENANRELAHMRNRLIEADKLAALGEIAAGVAHEIRNPLVSIGGFTRRIRKKVDHDSKIIPYLDVIIEEVARLETTLNNMLNFSSEDREHFKENDLNQIMDESLELLQRELGELNIIIERKYANDLPMVYCDDRQIKHVFFNIFLNASQAMSETGGKLTLRTFAIMREGKQFVAGEATDTGGGIPMDVIHNIFNPFFTTKSNGSGLGLSIVHKIVNRHFGQVEVHNSEGKGASFLVTLPAAEEGRAYLK